MRFKFYHRDVPDFIYTAQDFKEHDLVAVMWIDENGEMKCRLYPRKAVIRNIDIGTWERIT